MKTGPAEQRGVSWKAAVFLIAALAVLHLLIATGGWRQPLEGLHEFRQTQTALTSYWMLRGSPFLAYETPVFGPPWPVPFEFPLYQGLTAAWSRLSGMALDQSGRTVSLAFFYTVPFVMVWLTRRLRLPVVTAVLFSVLYLTSPLYLFWSRAFLIETTAAAFALAYFAAAAVGVKAGRDSLLVAAAVLGSVAGLVKVTTYAGALAAVSLFGVAWVWRERPPLRRIFRFAALALACPLVPAIWWVRFSDAVKILNPLQHQTSGDLEAWNFGQPALRISRDFWAVLYHYRFPDMLGDFWLPILVILPVAALYYRKAPALAVAAAFGFLAPTLVFAPLHYIHSYYPCGTALFLYAALAVLGGALWPSTARRQLAFGALAAILAAGNLAEYWSQYRPRVFPRSHPFLAAAQFVRAHTAPRDVLLVYQDDWNPIVSYYSERRAITDFLYRPLDSPEMQQTIAGLRLGERIGAVVACQSAREGWYAARVAETASRLAMATPWSFDNGECRVYLAQPGATPPAAPSVVDTGSVNALLRKMTAKGSDALAGALGPNLLLEGLDLRLLSAGPFPPAPMEDPNGRVAILADPDTRLSVAVPPSASEASLEFGIGDYAWKTGRAPAVDFSVDAVCAGAEEELWSRSLSPVIQRQDRGVQTVTLKLPEGTGVLILATTSSSRTPSHRAYWSGVRFTLAP